MFINVLKATNGALRELYLQLYDFYRYWLCMCVCLRCLGVYVCMCISMFAHVLIILYVYIYLQNVHNYVSTMSK